MHRPIWGDYRTRLHSGGGGLLGRKNEEHVALSNQLYLGPVLVCKGQALVMIRNVTTNNGL